MESIKVAIAEDQKIFRQGAVDLINSFEGIEIIGQVENGLQMIHFLEVETPDVILLDFRMPMLNGIETTKKIRETNETLKILLLSMYDSSEFVEAAIEAGASGFLSKDDPPEEIEIAIRSVMETGYFLNDRSNKMLISRLVQQGKIVPQFSEVPHGSFSEMDLDILKYIAEEFTTAEIADRLFKSSRTIESARTIMMQKVGAKNVVGLMMYAFKHKLIS